MKQILFFCEKKRKKDAVWFWWKIMGRLNFLVTSFDNKTWTYSNKAFLVSFFLLKGIKHSHTRLFCVWVFVPFILLAGWQKDKGGDDTSVANSWHSYPPLSVGVSPKRVHSPTDMSRELRTVTTAARARPHLDFTMSILPAQRTEDVLRTEVTLQQFLTPLCQLLASRENRWY